LAQLPKGMIRLASGGSLGDGFLSLPKNLLLHLTSDVMSIDVFRDAPIYVLTMAAIGYAQIQEIRMLKRCR